MKVRVKKLHPAAILPTYGSEGAACFDLHAIEAGVVSNEGSEVFRTGLAFEIPEGHVMQVFSRSGHGFKNDVRLSNSVGIIDADYRGEVMVKLRADALFSNLQVKPGDRIAQAIIMPYPSVRFELADDLTETARGAGGLGSTGA